MDINSGTTHSNFHGCFFAFVSFRNAPPSSAICIYSLSSINQVFDESSFKSFPNNEEHWTRIENKHKEYFQDVSIQPPLQEWWRRCSGNSIYIF